MMIEERLELGFATLPDATDIDGKTHTVKFDYGTEKDCHIFLNDNRDAKLGSYPLIWIETPVLTTGRLPKQKVKLKLILATLTVSEFTNKDRREITFKPILNPLLENVKKFFNRSGFTKMMNTDNEKKANHFNYAVDGKNKSTDIWDAITFECELQVSSCPQREVFY